MNLRRRKDGMYEVSGSSFIQNNTKMISVVINHNDLSKISFSEAFTPNTKKGNQRRISEKHADDFAQAILDDSKVTHPQSLVGTLCNGSKWEPKQDHSQIGKIVFPSKEGQFISLQDGQHSIQAVNSAKEVSDDGIEWEWQLALLPEAGWQDRVRTHHNINAHQRKPDRSALMHQNILIGNEEPLKCRVGKVFIKMESDDESVLKNRIKLFDTQTQRIPLPALVDKTVSVLRIGLVEQLNDSQLYSLMRDYYNLWEEEYEHIWEDQGNFILSKNLGIKVISRFLSSALRELAVSKNCIDLENIRKYIQKSKSRKMNWSKSATGADIHGHQIERHIYEELLYKSGLISTEELKDMRSRKDVA